jgi:hypothetical protein
VIYQALGRRMHADKHAVFLPSALGLGPRGWLLNPAESCWPRRGGRPAGCCLRLAAVPSDARASGTTGDTSSLQYTSGAGLLPACACVLPTCALYRPSGMPLPHGGAALALAGAAGAAAATWLCCAAQPPAPPTPAAREPPSRAAATATIARPKPSPSTQQEPLPPPEPEPPLCLPPVDFIPAAGAEGATTTFAGTTLIIPVISIGNAGQLAVDMLLASLQPSLRRVGFLDCPHVLPLAGVGATATGGGEATAAKKGKRGKGAAVAQQQQLLHVSVEVFHDADRRLTIVQQRAPVAPGMHAVHCSALAAWIEVRPQGFLTGFLRLTPSRATAGPE